MFLVLIALLSMSCNNYATTEKNVLLLGTVHTPTAKLNADSIYAVLHQWKPDIILMELDSSFFYDDFTYKTLFNGNEMIATVRYKMHFPNVAIRPIELTNRETLRDQLGVYPEITTEFGTTLQELANTNQLNEVEQKNLSQLFYYDSLINLLKQESLKVINTKKTDIIVDSLNFYKYVKLQEIAQNHSIFNTKQLVDAKKDTVSILDNFNLYVDFEMNKRNNALANNALTFIKNNPTKRILILVGFAHKSFIHSVLRKEQIDCQVSL